MSFLNSNFEGIFSTYVFGKSFWHYRDLKSWMLDIATYIMQKIF